jgi:hypothetical protein
MEINNKIVLTGTYESKQLKFRKDYIENKNNNFKFNLIKIFSKKIKNKNLDN